MPERFWKQEKAVGEQGKERKCEDQEIPPSDLDLLRRLEEYPELKAKIENMLAIMENAGGDVEKASEAEKRILEELRRMGKCCTVGRGANKRKRRKNTSASRG